MSAIHDALSKFRSSPPSGDSRPPPAAGSETRMMIRSGLMTFGLLIVVLLGVWWIAHRQTSASMPAKRLLALPISGKDAPVAAKPEVTLPQFIERATINRVPFALTGIIGNRQERLALINGTVVGQGDEIGGARVVMIEEDHVTLLHRERELVLQLR